MIGEILLLAIAVFGILILFGKAKPETFYKFVIFLICAPVLLAVGINHALWFWWRMPAWAQIVSILVLPFLLSAVLGILFPKAKWLQALQTIIFQTLVYAATFPFRFLWRAGRLFFRREPRTVRLNPYRPVLGGSPPVQTERHENNQRSNIFN